MFFAKFSASFRDHCHPLLHRSCHSLVQAGCCFTPSCINSAGHAEDCFVKRFRLLFLKDIYLHALSLGKGNFSKGFEFK
jgi:hypothetical protein